MIVLAFLVTSKLALFQILCVSGVGGGGGGGGGEFAYIFSNLNMSRRFLSNIIPSVNARELGVEVRIY